MARRRYKKPPFPDTPYFMLVDVADDVDVGWFARDSFVELPDMGRNVYGSQASGGGSPFFFRVTEIDGSEVVSLDGGGQARRYRMVPLKGAPGTLQRA
jgi:hypothetical protein